MVRDLTDQLYEAYCSRPWEMKYLLNELTKRLDLDERREAAGLLKTIMLVMDDRPIWWEERYDIYKTFRNWWLTSTRKIGHSPYGALSAPWDEEREHGPPKTTG